MHRSLNEEDSLMRVCVVRVTYTYRRVKSARLPFKSFSRGQLPSQNAWSRKLLSKVAEQCWASGKIKESSAQGNAGKLQRASTLNPDRLLRLPSWTPRTPGFVKPVMFTCFKREFHFAWWAMSLFQASPWAVVCNCYTASTFHITYQSSQAPLCSLQLQH